MLRSSTEEGRATVLRIPGLAEEPGLVHGFSTIALGNMRLPAGIYLTLERRAFAAELAIQAGRLTSIGAVHGAEVARVDEPCGIVRGVDALITDRPDVPLIATFADCCPVLLFDPGRRALGLAHAGWRGTAAAVARGMLEAMEREYGSRPGDMVAGLGPCVCGGCYEVGEEVAARFEPAVTRPSCDGRFLLDIGAANRRQLAGAGVPAERIHEHGACTMESAQLPSHRGLPDGNRFACLAAIR
jgi:polyphenol oxidase